MPASDIPRIVDPTHAAVVRAYQRGDSLEQIKTHFSFTHDQRVYSILHRYNIPLRNRPPITTRQFDPPTVATDRATRRAPRLVPAQRNGSESYVIQPTPESEPVVVTPTRMWTVRVMRAVIEHMPGESVADVLMALESDPNVVAVESIEQE
jgi:hypothetical protein